jgi:hypothetical protein
MSEKLRYYLDKNKVDPTQFERVEKATVEWLESFEAYIPDVFLSFILTEFKDGSK